MNATRFVTNIRHEDCAVDWRLVMGTTANRFEVVVEGSTQPAEAMTDLMQVLSDSGAGVSALGGDGQSDHRISPLEVTALLVTLGQAGFGLADMIGRIRRWLAEGRHKDVRTVKITIGSHGVEIAEPMTDAEERLLKAFLERNS
jgi:hypothetical protein